MRTFIVVTPFWAYVAVYGADGELRALGAQPTPLRTAIAGVGRRITEAARRSLDARTARARSYTSERPINERDSA